MSVHTDVRNMVTHYQTRDGVTWVCKEGDIQQALASGHAVQKHTSIRVDIVEDVEAEGD